jgi:hypothetical protein
MLGLSGSHSEAQVTLEDHLWQQKTAAAPFMAFFEGAICGPEFTRGRDDPLYG